MATKLVDRAGRIWRPVWLLAAGGAIIAGVLLWQAVTQAGVPDPSSTHLSRPAVVLDSSILVLREGLEAILVLMALMASMLGVNQGYRRPVAAGAGLALVASLATWFVVVAVISAVNAPELAVQAFTSLLALVVLVVIMNWFFHKVYWTGWISHHHRRKRDLLAAAGSRRRLLLGLVLLGFTAMYREGFEIVLFLQNLRLQAGTAAVAEGVAIASVLLAVVAYVTMAAHHKLPYKQMLVVTGVMLGFVFVVMVGESAQEMQQASWLSTTALPLPIPAWAGVWLAVFPNAEGLIAQALAALVVIGSYYAAEYIRVRRPLQQGEEPGRRSDREPAKESMASGRQV